MPRSCRGRGDDGGTGDDGDEYWGNGGVSGRLESIWGLRSLFERGEQMRGEVGNAEYRRGGARAALATPIETRSTVLEILTQRAL